MKRYNVRWWLPAMYGLGLGVLIGLTGCVRGESAKERKQSDNPFFTVDKLFTIDGCTVYRFFDYGNARYFTNCSGETSWTESCGKSCTRPGGVSGGAR